MIDRSRQLARIRRAARSAEWRMRADRALCILPTALTLALAGSAAVLAVRKTLPSALSEGTAQKLLALFAAGVALAFVVGLARRLAPRAGAIALDRHHRLSGRITNALAFEDMPAGERSPLMEVAIDDACHKAERLEPGKAAPIRLSRDFGATGAVAVGLLAVALLEVRTPRREAPRAQTIDALTMTPDDVALFKDMAKELEREDQSPEVKAAIDRFNQLIEDIANKRLDRKEAFRRMEAIERELLKGAEADKKALEEALRETGEALRKSDLSKPLGDSLAKKDLEQAKKDLKDLAQKLRDKKKPNKADLERLQKALKKAAEKRKEALKAINDKRAELREQLLKKKQQAKDPDAGPKEKQEEQLLKKKERELERLDREAEQQERVSRQLDRLDRELAKAAEDLMKDLGMSAEDLEKAAEDLNRMQQEELSDKEKEELKKRLEELREVLRQQGQGGKKRMSRMLKFGKKANGGKGQPGGQGQDGQDPGEEGEGKEGEGKEGEGKEGEGQGGKKPGQGQKWALGPGGKKILLPGGGQGDKPGGQGNQPGGGSGEGGKEAGKGAGGPVAGAKTDLKGETHDVQAQGAETGQGPSNSEVILSAAERGFRGAPYKKVFTRYSTVAEEQIGKDKIPDGYRSYVNRYFQLIRPRE